MIGKKKRNASRLVPLDRYSWPDLNGATPDMANQAKVGQVGQAQPDPSKPVHCPLTDPTWTYQGRQDRPKRRQTADLGSRPHLIE